MAILEKLWSASWMLSANLLLADDSIATCSNCQLPGASIRPSGVVIRLGGVCGSESIGIDGCHRGGC